MNNIRQTQTDWRLFSEDIFFEKNIIYIFKISREEYYSKIAEKYQKVLSVEELKRVSGFISKADAERFISGRYLLRNILSKIISTNPREIRFHTSGNKKPGITGIEFNISHSGNYILLAIGPNAVGIDIELINLNFDYKPILTTCFSLDEISFINNGNNPIINFYILWTRKEAILKATGEGLTDNMEKVTCLTDAVERDMVGYNLISFDIENEYVACLATPGKKDEIIYYTL